MSEILHIKIPKTNEVKVIVAPTLAYDSDISDDEKIIIALDEEIQKLRELNAEMLVLCEMIVVAYESPIKNVVLEARRGGKVTAANIYKRAKALIAKAEELK